MTVATKRDRQMLKADISFGLMGAFGIFGLALDSFDATREAIAPPQPWLTAAVVVALAVLIGFIVTKVASIDRQHSEEYTFQIMANGAVVSVVTTLFVTLAWTSDFLLSRWLGDPTSAQIIALLMASWSIGFFTYRIRGVGE